MISSSDSGFTLISLKTLSFFLVLYAKVSFSSPPTITSNTSKKSKLPNGIIIYITKYSNWVAVDPIIPSTTSIVTRNRGPTTKIDIYTSASIPSFSIKNFCSMLEIRRYCSVLFFRYAVVSPPLETMETRPSIKSLYFSDDVLIVAFPRAVSRSCPRYDISLTTYPTSSALAP